MPVTTEPSAELLEATRQSQHPRCVVCGRPERSGLGLEFAVQDDGSVTARFDCRPMYEGYNGLLHGGVISAIADGAMANCLFAHGIVAVTAELNVRFRHSVALGTTLVVMARIIRQSETLFLLEADLMQDEEIKVKATGKFLQRPLGT
jgi:uncharacterized protein (TIGR00369 family)